MSKKELKERIDKLEAEVQVLRALINAQTVGPAIQPGIGTGSWPYDGNMKPYPSYSGYQIWCRT